MKSDLLQVPGAQLYYEIRGSGPLLLNIAGGAMDSNGLALLADELAGDYTVVNYDPRGNSRSVRESGGPPLSVELLADDALALLDTLDAASAKIFGSSGGAMAALDLVARHPERVEVLIAHEPPSTELLPDADELRAQGAKISETFRKQGPGAAMQLFMTTAGLEAPRRVTFHPHGRCRPECNA